MEIKSSFAICFLMLIVAGIGECSDVKHLILTEGDTLALKCLRGNSSENVHIEFRNPQNHLMSFNNQLVLRDSRISIFTINDSEYMIHLSSVTFKDEGVYQCLQYEDKIILKIFEVKVLGTPKIQIAKHGDKTTIKCWSVANGYPPELSWLLGETEIEGPLNTTWDAGSNRSLVVSVLKIKTHTRNTTVKCLATYQALQKQVVASIVIENDSIKVPTSSYSRTTGTPKTETTAPFSSITANMELTSLSERPKSYSTEESTSFTSTPTQYTNSSSDTSSVTNSTEESQIKNGTSSEGFEDRKPEQQNSVQQSSPLLVFLMICLIICLLTVIVFFAIKLRRAHLAWKKENEESDQSVESSKSKSSHEEKQAQEKRNGFWNSKFTEYKIEEEISQNEANLNNTEATSDEQDSSIKITCVKETEI